MCAKCMHIWRLENSLLKLVLFFHHMGTRIEYRSPGLVAGDLPTEQSRQPTLTFSGSIPHPLGALALGQSRTWEVWLCEPHAGTGQVSSCEKPQKAAPGVGKSSLWSLGNLLKLAQSPWDCTEAGDCRFWFLGIAEAAENGATTYLQYYLSSVLVKLYFP